MADDVKQSPGTAKASTVQPRVETYDFRVRGMDCPSCAQDIARAVNKISGVQGVTPDIVAGRVQVAYIPGAVAREDVASVIRRIGYRVETEVNKLTAFTVEGMDCADEVRQIQDTLGKLPGVSKLQFDLIGRRLTIEGAIPESEVQRTIQTLGMTAHPQGAQIRPATFWEKQGRLITTVVSGIFLAVAGLLIVSGAGRQVTIPLLAISAVAGGWFIAPRGLRAAASGLLDMNFLMTIAAVGAAAIGEWGEGASAMFLFSVAQLLESHSMDRARNAIKALMNLSPAEATVRRGETERTVPVAEVKVQETIVVRPGQRVPLDGTVVGGKSSLNQAPITGESFPVDVQPGSQVFAGSINIQGLLQVQVTKLSEDTTLARIIHAVEKAHASRAPSQSFVDRFSRVYTPAVVSFAALLTIAPPLLGLGAWHTWFYRALTMLVIAWPCALVISTPVSIVSGLARAARSGVLIKGGVHLESAGTITAIAFDKTGTLTLGQPRVTEVVPLDGGGPDEVLKLAAALEHGSEHPIAEAIIQQAKSQKLDLPAVTDFEALAGRGVRGTIAGKVFYLGNERLCHELGYCTPKSEEALRSIGEQGKTAVLLFSENKPVGVIAVADQVRPQAAQAIQSLRWLGLKRILMLTGDNEKTANGIADQLKITDYRAELLPDDKVAAVQEMTNSGDHVAFVGDGVNDAPAMAAATVGIVMGAAGTDVALETADIALMADDLSRIPFAIRLSRQTLAIVKQNIWFSITVKGIFMVLAVTGWATLWMAVAADMGASLAVIANGLRTLRAKD